MNSDIKASLLIVGICVWAGLMFLTTNARSQPLEVERVFPESQVIDSQVVDLGDRTISYHRIETPLLKSQPTQAAAKQEVAEEYVPTAEELAEIRRWESLRFEYLSGSATFFDGVGSELRLWTPEGEVVAMSSIDFNFLQMLWDFEGEGVFYSVFFVALDITPEEFVEAKTADPSWISQFGPFPKESGGMSRYVIISAPKGETAALAIQALEDLHAHFDANRKQLRTTYDEFENIRIVQEEWNKAHPPQPVSTTITYFPIRSSQLTATEKARLSKVEK